MYLRSPPEYKSLNKSNFFCRYDADMNLIFGEKKRPPRKKDSDILIRAFEGDLVVFLKYRSRLLDQIPVSGKSRAAFESNDSLTSIPQCL